MRTRKERIAPRIPLRIHVVAVVVLIADIMLRLAKRLYRAVFLDLAGIENAVHLSRKLRRFGWRLLRSKRSSADNDVDYSISIGWLTDLHFGLSVLTALGHSQAVTLLDAFYRSGVLVFGGGSLQRLI